MRIDSNNVPELPGSCPEHPGNACHLLVRPQLPFSLQDKGKAESADHDEEPGHMGELRAAPEASELPDVHDGGNHVGAHN